MKGVITFGRMNPITQGHEKLINHVTDLARTLSASHRVVLSASQDKKKNPLDVTTKLKYAKHVFPNVNIIGASKDKPTILHHLSDMHSDGITDAHVVVGGDRKQEMSDLINKYNGTEGRHGLYNFNNITVHSAGDRDPDADDVSGMSASKLRSYVSAGDKEGFFSGLSTRMSPEYKENLYKDLRSSMKLDESVADKTAPELVILAMNGHEGAKAELKKRGITINNEVYHHYDVYKSGIKNKVSSHKGYIIHHGNDKPVVIKTMNGNKVSLRDKPIDSVHDAIRFIDDHLEKRLNPRKNYMRSIREATDFVLGLIHERR